MTPRHGVSSLVAGAALAACFGGAVVLAVARDRVYGEPSAGAPVMYVRSPEAIRRAALSYSAVAADVYWIRALQYYGGTRLSRDAHKTYDLLYPLLDITTTLDPRFRTAYRFGAIFLAEPYPGGAGRPDLAVALLEKGFKVDPREWRYLQDIGFVYYWWAGDFRQAAEWFQRASDVPGAPWWMRMLAANTHTEGGDRQISRTLWQSFLAGAENEWMAREARRRLQQLDALDQVDRLGAIVQAYRLRRGANPRSWRDLIAAGYLRGVPGDPSGAPYLLDAATAAVSVDPSSRLFPLPTGARASVSPR